MRNRLGLIGSCLGPLGLAALLTGASCSSSGSGDIVVIVSVMGQPAESQSLRVTSTLNGTAAVGAEEFAGSVSRFGLSLPKDSSGELRLNIDAVRADRCVVARGIGQTRIDGASRVEVAVNLAALLAKECNGRVQPTVAVLKTGDGSGTVTSQPDGISCGETCSAEFQDGSTVSLTAQPAMGSNFVGWEGGCAGTDPMKCQVTASGLVTVTANFSTTMGPGPGPGPSAAACLEPGWCWHNPLPQGNLLRKVWGTSANSIWAVGDFGTILKWDGKSWLPVSSGTTNNLNYVWGASETDTWIAGDRGTILRWDGTKWSSVASGLTAPEPNLYGIWGSAANDVWIGMDLAGTNRSMLRWNGTQWSIPTNSPNVNLRAVWGSSANEVHAVGTTGYRFDGASWVSNAAFSGTMLSLHGQARNKLWALGSTNVYRWDGSSWLILTQMLPGTLRDLWGTSDVSLWAASDQGLLYYNGVWSPPTASPAYSVFGTGANSIWAVGPGGSIEYWNGTPPWSTSAPGPRRNLLATWASSDKDVWAVGSVPGGTTGAAMHWDGTAWTTVDPKAARLQAIHGSAANDVWAVGLNGAITHYDGTSWTSVMSPTTSTLYGVFALSPNRAWAVGDRVFLNWDGTRWATSSISYYIQGLWGIDATNMWGVGSDYNTGYGVILRFNGTSWSVVRQYSSISYLNAIWASSMTDIWVAGNGGAIYRSTDGGTNWTQAVFPFDSNYTFRGIWGNGTKTWVMGDRNGSTGAMFRWDGVAWSPVSQISNRLFGVFGTGGKAWAVGDRGTILQFKP